MTLKYEDAMAQAVRRFGLNPNTKPRSKADWFEMQRLAPQISRLADSISLSARLKEMRSK